MKLAVIRKHGGMSILNFDAYYAVLWSFLKRKVVECYRYPRSPLYNSYHQSLYFCVGYYVVGNGGFFCLWWLNV